MDVLLSTYSHTCISSHCSFYISLSCLQVFGDYYHFRHHAVEKRALSGHRGIHVRLHEEPQVRELSASHGALQLAIAKIQKADCITEKNANITTEKKNIPVSLTACQAAEAFRSRTFSLIFPLSSIWGATQLHICKTNNCKKKKILNKSCECLVCHVLIFLPFYKEIQLVNVNWLEILEFISPTSNNRFSIL